jgi:hypothetical protein
VYSLDILREGAVPDTLGLRLDDQPGPVWPPELQHGGGVRVDKPLVAGMLAMLVGCPELVT